MTTPPPDISQPLSDRSHEALRLNLVALMQRVDAVTWRADADVIRDGTAQDGVDQLQNQMADVLERLAALEAPAPPGP